MFKDSVKILIGTAIANLFSILRTFMIVRQLNPEIYGIWNLFTVVLSYSLWCEFGVLSGMDKLVPYFKGQSNHEEAFFARDIAFTMLILIYLVITGGFALAASVPLYPFPPEILTSLYLLGGIIFLSAMQNFFLTVSRAEKKFGFISFTTAFFAIATVILLLFAYEFLENKLHATLWAFLLSYALSMMLCLFASGLTFRFRLNLAKLKNIIATGFPLILIGIGYILFTSVDRWMIAAFLTKWDLGLYAFGYSVGILLYSIVAVVAYVVYPRMREKFGEGMNSTFFRPHITKALVAMSYIVGLSGSVLMISLPFLCRFFFPSYAGAVSMTGILMAGFFFVSLATIAGNFLVAADRQNTILFLQVLLTGGVLLADYLVIQTTGDVHGVAVATACFLSLYGLAIIYSSYRHMQCSFQESCRILLGLAVPLAVAMMISCGLLAANGRLFAQDSYMVLIPEILVVTSIFVGIFVVQGKKTGILDDIRPLLAEGMLRYRKNLFF